MMQRFESSIDVGTGEANLQFTADGIRAPFSIALDHEDPTIVVEFFRRQRLVNGNPALAFDGRQLSDTLELTVPLRLLLDLLRPVFEAEQEHSP